MSAAEEGLREALDDLPRARSLLALVRWALSHRDPPSDEAWGGLYVVACDAEKEMEAVEKGLREALQRSEARRPPP